MIREKGLFTKMRYGRERSHHEKEVQSGVRGASASAEAGKENDAKLKIGTTKTKRLRRNPESNHGIKNKYMSKRLRN